MKRKKLIEQLKKLRNMAERGATEHERDTAQRIFDTLCQSHGITPDELVEVREVRFFEVKTEYDRRLLLQIVCAVLDSREISIWKQGQKRNKRGYELTKAEYVKVERLYRIYREAFGKEVERTYRAFVEANRIYPETATGDTKDLTEEELEELQRIVMMSTIMTKSRINAEIGRGE